MQEAPRKLVTYANIDLCRMTSEITHLWASDKVTFRTEIQVYCLGIDKITTIFIKILCFSQKQQIWKIKPFEY